MPLPPFWQKLTINPSLTPALLLFLAFFAGVNVPCAAAALRARHHCILEASVAKVLGQHADCVVLIDGPTCTGTTVRDGGCKDTRTRNFTSCGEVLYNEVEDPESREGEGSMQGVTTFSHCAYSARPAGSPCHVSRQPGAATADAVSELRPPAHECGGGLLRGMCIPAGSHAPEHEQCTGFSCEKGLCELPTPTNEGGECAPPGPAPPPAPPLCQRRSCRAGRCVVEPLPDDTACGPTGPCGSHLCMDGSCVLESEEDGVMCGPSTACSDQVCMAGECREERRADGQLCWYAPGGCPRMCTAGRCTQCQCGPAYAYWAGRQEVPGFQWTPFPTDLRENSFGGYFNLLAEEMDIPPVRLPYNGSSASSRHAAESAIVVCSGCRLAMQLQPGNNMVQNGALLTGAVGLAASPVRGGTYVTLDVVMFPNVTHHHLLVGWYPWASISPPPLNTPQRWGNLNQQQHHPASPAPGADPAAPVLLSQGHMPRPTSRHSSWAFVRKRPAHWALTTCEQMRSVFVGLHLTVASCSKAPPLSAAPTAAAAAAAAAAASASASAATSSATATTAGGAAAEAAAGAGVAGGGGSAPEVPAGGGVGAAGTKGLPPRGSGGAVQGGR